MTFRRIAAATAAGIALVAAAAAPAQAEAPAVTTGAATQITQTTATLAGQVNPRGKATTYYFEYGPTRSYGTRTETLPAGSGTSARAVAAHITRLAPATRYHYRLVARNADGVTRGARRTFTTRRQPLGLSLTADVNPVTWGAKTSVRGVLSGTGNAGQQVVLQARMFPFTASWQDIAPAVVTDAAGNFAFTNLGPLSTTQFRVRAASRPGVTSPVVTVGVGPRIATYVRRTVRRGGLLEFSGLIRPARPGAQVGIQKRNTRDGWSIVGGTITRGGSDTHSRYRKSIRVPRGGTYRILVATNDGHLVPNRGTEIRVRTVR